MTATITAGTTAARAEHFDRHLSTAAWRRRSAAKGAHSERLYDWARITLPGPATSRGRWVLARRRISDGEIAHYVGFARPPPHSRS